MDQTLSPSCDMFSLGLLIIALYNSPHKSPLETHNSSSTYRRLLGAQSTTPNGSNNFLSSRPMPRHVTSSVLPQLITRRSASRMNARAFQESEYFDNILVSTLRFLDTFPAKTPNEKAAFMRGLPKILSQFPKSVLEKKILPGLVEELRDGSLLALILPNIFAIVESAQPKIFSEKVLKRLKEVFLSGASASSSEPKTAAAKTAERERLAGQEGGLTVILSKLPLIKEKTTALEFKEDVIPLVQLALESSTHSLQDLGLRSLPIILPKLDFPTLKNDFFPIVASVFTKTSSLGIKIRGLEAFRVLCGGTPSSSFNLAPDDGLNGFSPRNDKKEEAPVLDKYTIQEKVIPLLKGIKTKEPAVMMEALGVFAEIGKTCDREVVAMEILPTLWTMSFGPLINLDQVRLPSPLANRPHPNNPSLNPSCQPSNPSPKKSRPNKPANYLNSHHPTTPAPPPTSLHSAPYPATTTVAPRPHQMISKPSSSARGKTPPPAPPTVSNGRHPHLPPPPRNSAGRLLLLLRRRPPNNPAHQPLPFPPPPPPSTRFGLGSDPPLPSALRLHPRQVSHRRTPPPQHQPSSRY